MLVTQPVVRGLERDEDSMDKLREDMCLVACDGESVVPVYFTDPRKEERELAIDEVEITDLADAQYAEPSA